MTKIVLITGGATRIGAVITEFFHQQSYNVIIHYRSKNNKNNAENLLNIFNQRRANSAVMIDFALADLHCPQHQKLIANKIISYFGKLDVLVNNASSFFPTVFNQATFEQWHNLMTSNASGPFFLVQSLAALLKENNGAIINISDIHALRSLAGYSIYSMAKACNNMLTKTLAKELAPDVRVNGVAPGPILWPEDKDENGISEAIKAKIIQKTLLKKLGSPLDIAKAVYFLAESSYITGQILAIDGGRSIK